MFWILEVDAKNCWVAWIFNFEFFLKCLYNFSKRFNPLIFTCSCFFWYVTLSLVLGGITLFWFANMKEHLISSEPQYIFFKEVTILIFSPYFDCVVFLFIFINILSYKLWANLYPSLWDIYILTLFKMFFVNIFIYCICFFTFLTFK